LIDLFATCNSIADTNGHSTILVGQYYHFSKFSNQCGGSANAASGELDMV
jgi:hypothetical protein